MYSDFYKNIYWMYIVGAVVSCNTFNYSLNIHLKNKEGDSILSPSLSYLAYGIAFFTYFALLHLKVLIIGCEICNTLPCSSNR